MYCALGGSILENFQKEAVFSQDGFSYQKYLKVKKKMDFRRKKKALKVPQVRGGGETCFWKKLQGKLHFFLYAP